MMQVINAIITLLPAESGGRTTPTTAVACHYRPHLRVEPNGPYMGVCLIAGPERLYPGDEATVTMALVYYGSVDYSALASGASFEILEGPTVVGHGVVTKGLSESDEYTQTV